jgi:hypothetical protein
MLRKRAPVASHSVFSFLSHYLQAWRDHLRPRIPLYAAQFANRLSAGAGAEGSAKYNAAAAFARMHNQENQIVTVPAAAGNTRTLWLGEAVSQEVPTTADPALPDDPAMPKDSRNQSAVRNGGIEGTSLANGEDPNEISVAAPESARPCGPETAQDESGRIVDDAVATEQAKLEEPAEWDPPIPFNEYRLPPFPVQALPGWLADYVQAVATATQTTTDLAGMLVLTAVAAACAKKVEVQINEGYVEPVNIFTVTALPPASGKSPVFSSVFMPIEEFEQETRQQLKPELAEKQSRYNIDKKRLARMEKDIASGESEDQQQLEQEARALARDLAGRKVPSLPRYIANDATPEQLVSPLAANDGRMAILSPEGNVLM